MKIKANMNKYLNGIYDIVHVCIMHDLHVNSFQSEFARTFPK